MKGEICQVLPLVWAVRTFDILAFSEEVLKHQEYQPLNQFLVPKNVAREAWVEYVTDFLKDVS